MIVKVVNQKIDIPNMNEQQEKKLFESIINALCIYLKIPKP